MSYYDDHHIVRKHEVLLSTTDNINVVDDFAVAGNTRLSGKSSPKVDLILLDLVMPQMDIELTRIIKTEYPKVKVLVLSSYTSEEYIRPVFQAGQTDISSRKWKQKNWLID